MQDLLQSLNSISPLSAELQDTFIRQIENNFFAEKSLLT